MLNFLTQIEVSVAFKFPNDGYPDRLYSDKFGAVEAISNNVLEIAVGFSKMGS